MTHMFRVCAGLAIIVAGGIQLASCQSPTYGTDKTAAEQLLDDIGDAVTAGSPQKNAGVKYQPRPELVVPQSDVALAAPQKSLADRENNPDWVESPEEARKRLRAEADLHKDDHAYRSPLRNQTQTSSTLSIDEQKKQYEENRKARYGISDGGRRFLSDPPTKYRKVEDAAALADLGEPESVKEKRRKKAAKLAEKGSKGSQWWDPLNLF